jgi:putative acetyltransferase
MDERADRVDTMLRPERASDHAAIAALVEAAFGQPMEARLVERLRGEPATIAHVAVSGGEIVGHVMASRVTHANGGAGFAGIAPLAVASAWRRRGIGAQLMNGMIAALRARGDRLAVLVGDLRYHARFGFVPATPLGITCRWPEVGQHFGVLELQPGAAAGACGRLEYSPAFDDC